MASTEESLRKQIQQLQNDLQKLQAKCDLLEQNDSEFIWMLDRNFRFEYVSPASKKRLGYDSDELIGKSVDVFFDKKTLKNLRTEFAKLYRRVYFEKLNEFPGCMEFEFNTKEGNKVWFEVVFKVALQNQKIHKIHGSACDITTRKQAQEAFDLSHNALDMILDGIDTIIMVSDIQTHKLLYVNNYTQKNYGVVPGKNCWTIFQHTQKSSCPFCDSHKLFDQHGLPLDAQIWEHKIEGNNKWFEISNKAIRWVDGRWVRLEIASEITNRKKDEKRLLQMIRQQSILSEISLTFNQSNDLKDQMNKVLQILGNKVDFDRILIGDYQDNILRVRHKWDSAIKEPEEEKERKDFYDTDFPIEKLKEKKILKIKDINQVHVSQKFLQFCQDNQISAIMAVPLYESGQINGIVAFEHSEPYIWMMHEMTLLKTLSSIISVVYDRHYAYNQLKISEAGLSEANAAKDKFFSIIAHDLKNPFSNLIGISDLLVQNLHQWEMTKIEQFVGYLNTSANQGYELLKNLLEWSRSQTGRIAFSPKKINIFQLTESIINLLISNANSKKISLQNNLNKDIVLNVDENMMATVFRNLVSNAIKFTNENGSITISGQPNTEYYDIIVADNGVGMTAEDQERLFRIDVNHSTKGTNQEAGTGLGLIICKEFIERHGGNIRVESYVNKGSKFILSIPF